MSFFARPNLSDEQFKQIPGTTSILTLSGQTRIVTVSGLTLAGGAGENVILTAEGAASRVGNVLTFTCVGGIPNIVLCPAGSAGDIIYNKKSPTTCTVGGLVCNSPISGCTITDILEKILVPTLNPTLTPPSNTLSLSPSITTYEVGAVPSLSVSATFSRGSVSPVYCGGTAYRTGAATGFNYIVFGSSCPTQGTGAAYSLAPYSILAGNNTISGTVSYACGEFPLDSEGNPFGTKCPAGTTGAQTITICGLYPYFYGKVASGGAPAGSNRPSATCALVNSGTKTVAGSSGTITVNFGSTADDYIWFAIPNASTSKTCWYVDATNKGNIGGGVSAGCNLFPAFDSVSVSTVCWAGQTYKVYISNYQTASTLPMELRNS